jgi:hypothetical protein
MQGITPEDPEASFRRGYEHAAIETFHAIERFLDPSTREVLRTWIEEDVYVPSRHSAGSQFRTELRAALDKLIKHKVEDFEFDITEANDVTPTIQNTVSITNSTNPNLVVQSTQSGNAISRDTALKLLELVNSDEIKELPENDRLEVLDQVTDIVKELNAPTTDKDKVHRGLERLGEFLSQVASDTVAETVAQAAIAYATFYIDQESSTRLKQ